MGLIYGTTNDCLFEWYQFVFDDILHPYCELLLTMNNPLGYAPTFGQNNILVYPLVNRHSELKNHHV